MNAEQKRAWLGVISGIACLVGFLVLAVLRGMWPATAAFSLFAVNGFAGLIGRKEKQDERDKSIIRRAGMIGFIASYEAFVAGCMGIWGVAFMWQKQTEVLVHFFPLLVFVSVIVLYLVRSVAILVLYGRHVEADND